MAHSRSWAAGFSEEDLRFRAESLGCARRRLAGPGGHADAGARSAAALVAAAGIALGRDQRLHQRGRASGTGGAAAAADGGAPRRLRGLAARGTRPTGPRSRRGPRRRAAGR